MCARHQHNPLSLLLFLDSQRHSFFEVFFLLRPFWQDSTLRRNSKLSVRPDVIIENCWGHPRSLSVVRMCRRSHNRPTHFLWPSLPPYPLTPSSHLPPPSSQSSESCYDDRSKYEMDGWRRSCGGSCPTLLSAWQEGRCLPVLPGWWKRFIFFYRLPSGGQNQTRRLFCSDENKRGNTCCLSSKRGQTLLSCEAPFVEDIQDGYLCESPLTHTDVFVSGEVESWVFSL